MMQLEWDGGASATCTCDLRYPWMTRTLDKQKVGRACCGCARARALYRPLDYAIAMRYVMRICMSLYESCAAAVSCSKVKIGPFAAL